MPVSLDVLGEFLSGFPAPVAIEMEATLYPNRPSACRKWKLRPCGDALPELLGEPDEKSFRAADVAEPIRLLVLNHFADELRAALGESGERPVNVVHSEHHA